MHIERLRLENFRGFAELDLPLHPRLNVLIGPNGVGKSTVLKALRAFLTSIDLASSSRGMGSEVFSQGELQNFIRRGAERFCVRTTCRADGHSFTSTLASNSAQLSQRDLLAAIYPPGSIGPILKYMSPTRFLDQNFGVAEVSGLPDGQRFHALISWLLNVHDREAVRLTLGGQRTHYATAEHENFRSLLRTFFGLIPDVQLEFSEIAPISEGVPFTDRVIMQKGHEPVALSQLSEGESMLVAVVGSLAQSHMPLFGTSEPNRGVVLIDGIELHLHPRWQRAIMPALTATFPNMQFIVTTHSPQVIGEVPRECVISFDDFRVVPTPPTYGKDTNSILETVMGASSRDEAIKAQLATLSDLIEADDFDAARARIKELSALLGDDDPVLAGSRAAIDFLDGDE